MYAGVLFMYKYNVNKNLIRPMEVHFYRSFLFSLDLGECRKMCSAEILKNNF